VKRQPSRDDKVGRLAMALPVIVPFFPLFLGEGAIDVPGGHARGASKDRQAREPARRFRFSFSARTAAARSQHSGQG